MYRPSGARRNRSLKPELPRSARHGKSNQSNAKSQPNSSSLDDEYLGALDEAVRELDARREQGRDGLWCICRRKEIAAGSVNMYECEDPGCHIKWYHDICVSTWEKDMIAKDPHWICKLCFDRRQASRYATLRRSDGEKLDQPTSPAANGEGKGKEAAQRQPEALAQGSGVRKLPSTGPVQATSGRKQPELTNASRERPDQRKILQEIISKRARRRPWTMHDQEQEMRRVDAYLQNTDQWFYPGPDPPKNDQNDTFENTETGERRVLPMVGAGHQVTHTFATDFKERKRVSLEIVARTITNRLTLVEKGRNDYPVFQYHHGEM